MFKLYRDVRFLFEMDNKNITVGVLHLRHNSQIPIKIYVCQCKTLFALIKYLCGLGFVGGCSRCWAEHSHCRAIGNVINFCGNALPLRLVLPKNLSATLKKGKRVKGESSRERKDDNPKTNLAAPIVCIVPAAVSRATIVGIDGPRTAAQ